MADVVVELGFEVEAEAALASAGKWAARAGVENC